MKHSNFSRILSFVLALVMVLSMVACGAKEETGAKIAAQKGTTSFMYADALKNTKVTTYDTFALAAKDMINGNADYLFVDKTTAKALAKEIAGLKIIEIALSSENYGIGIDPETITECLGKSSLARAHRGMECYDVMAFDLR